MWVKHCLLFLAGFPWWLSGKGSACQAGDKGQMSGSGRSPGEGNDNPLQYSCPWMEKTGGLQPMVSQDSLSLNHQGSPMYTWRLDIKRTGVLHRTRGTGFATCTWQERGEFALFWKQTDAPWVSKALHIYGCPQVLADEVLRAAQRNAVFSRYQMASLQSVEEFRT